MRGRMNENDARVVRDIASIVAENEDLRTELAAARRCLPSWPLRTGAAMSTTSPAKPSPDTNRRTPVNNVLAKMLSDAAKSADKGGDFIDHGWALLKEMHARGFVITVAPGARADQFMSFHRKGESLNQMCGLRHQQEPTK